MREELKFEEMKIQKIKRDKREVEQAIKEVKYDLRMKKDIHNGEVKILSNEIESSEKELETIEITHYKCEKEII